MGNAYTRLKSRVTDKIDEREREKKEDELHTYPTRRTLPNHDLILDLMEYFCFAVKAKSNFRGVCQFRFQAPDGDVASEEHEINVAFYDSDDSKDARPRVVVHEGKAPPDLPIKCVICCPYDYFMQIYSGRATYSEISKMIFQRAIHVTSWKEVVVFAAAFEYTGDCWKRFYKAKAGVDQPTLEWHTPGTSGQILFSSDSFRKGVDASGEGSSGSTGGGVLLSRRATSMSSMSSFSGFSTPSYGNGSKVLHGVTIGGCGCLSVFPPLHPWSSFTNMGHLLPAIPTIQSINFRPLSFLALVMRRTAHEMQIGWSRIYTSPRFLPDLRQSSTGACNSYKKVRRRGSFVPGCCDLSDWWGLSLAIQADLDATLVQGE